MRFVQLLSRLVVCCGCGVVASPAAAYTFINVADTGTPGPIGTFDTLGAPSMSGGTAAFLAGHDAHWGIFTGNGGALTTIAKDGDTSPAGGTFSYLNFPSLSGSAVAFIGGGEQSAGYFLGSGGALTTIAKIGDVLPGGEIVTGLGWGGPSLSGATAAFRCFWRMPYPPYEDSGIFTGMSGTLTEIVRAGDTVPSGTLQYFGDFPSKSGDTVAFKAFTNHDGYQPAHGIFTGSGGPLTTIAKLGDPAPVGTFSNFWDPSIGGDMVAFVGHYNSGADRGVFVKSGAALTAIAKKGDPAPIGTFSDFLAYTPVNAGMVAFLGIYDNSLANHGIFTYSDGMLSALIKTGDPLFGSTVTGLSLNFSAVDEVGNIGFQYRLADGRYGVAIALVPEPSSLALLAISAVLLLAYASRRR